MQEFTLVHYWMSGVMLVMFIYLGFALVGKKMLAKRQSQKDDQVPPPSD